MKCLTGSQKKQLEGLLGEVIHAHGGEGIREVFEVMKDVEAAYDGEMARTFKPGERVFFMHNGRRIEGTVKSIGDRNLVLTECTDSPRGWRVGAGFVKRVNGATQPAKAASKGLEDPKAFVQSLMG